jgi:hypothetical protein
MAYKSLPVTSYTVRDVQDYIIIVVKYFKIHLADCKYKFEYK